MLSTAERGGFRALVYILCHSATQDHQARRLGLINFQRHTRLPELLTRVFSTRENNIGHILSFSKDNDCSIEYIGVLISTSQEKMDGHDPPPNQLIELMKDAHEVDNFENFKTTSANYLHPGFRQRTLYDDQRAIFTPLPSKLVDSAWDDRKALLLIKIKNPELDPIRDNLAY